MRGFIIGLFLGLLILPAAAWGWFRFGHPPVAVSDAPLPFEQQIVNVPLHARIDREAPAHPGMAASPTNLLIGAGVYRSQCASCHGLYGRDSSYGAHMFPKSPQLWAPHGHGVVGVSDDPAGETYWKVKNGIRLSGMPSFKNVLNEEQMWQVSVLLAGADKQLPADVLTLLKQPLIAEVHPIGPVPPSGPMIIPVQPLPTE